MILFFHFVCLLARYIISNISKSFTRGKLFWEEETSDASNENQFSEYLKAKSNPVRYPVYEGDTLKFFPPVYVQRYETVALILEDVAQKYNIKKVADFGCSGLGFLMYLKSIKGVTEILEIDVNSEILEQYSYKAAPLTSDYLMGKWEKPLDIYILAGSIADYDDHLIGCDALVAIELIEHLTDEDFEKMPYNVFYKIKPKLVIFTTPNAEFNSLFPNFTDFRHTDHKFEWTRREFYDWTQLVLSLYPEYSVRFYGIGAGPEGTENLGCCTQMAVFLRSDDSEFFLSAREESKGINTYRLIQHYKYPLYIDTRNKEEKIIHEIQYQTAHLSTLEKFYNYKENESEIPLRLLKEYVSDMCRDEEELLTILKSNEMTVRWKDNAWFLVNTEVYSNPSDITPRCDDWLDNEVSESFYEKDNLLSERLFWDNEQPCSEDIVHLPCDGNLRELNHIDKNYFLDTVRQECIAMSTEVKSAPNSCNNLVDELDSEKLSVESENKSEKCKNLRQSKSRIPIMKNERYENEGRNGTEASLAFLFKPYNKISKSFSLDSCLENINYTVFGNESYLNLILGGSSSSNVGGSLLAGERKHMKNCSGSSLLSSSLDRAGDSGFPISFSPPDDNLTPEQVDELFTENEMSRSTSSSSEVDMIDVVNHRLHHIFIEDIPVENGDLANNNRDGEGNNVEGLMGQRLFNDIGPERDPNDNLFFLEAEEFPAWLLNLGELALRPVYLPLHNGDYDEDKGDDSSGHFSHSPDLEDIDFDI